MNQYIIGSLDDRDQVESATPEEKDILIDIFNKCKRVNIDGTECVVVDDMLNGFKPYIKACNNDYSEFSERYSGLYDAWWPLNIQGYPKERQEDLRHTFKRINKRKNDGERMNFQENLQEKIDLLKSIETFGDLENASKKMSEIRHRDQRLLIEDYKKQGISAKECLKDLKKDMVGIHSMFYDSLSDINGGQEFMEDEARDRYREIKKDIEEIYGVKFRKRKRRK